jgi:hypothetical protein
MSTMRSASMRGLGGSTPNSFGGSPLSTHRQNFRSARFLAAELGEVARTADLDAHDAGLVSPYR